MKKRVLNIKPQEVTTDGRTSVRYKGSDGKMHSLASSANENGAGEPIAASPATVQSYAVANNPNAFEIVPTGEYLHGTATYKALTCDENQTEIAVSDFIALLLANPNTTVISKSKPNEAENDSVDILRLATVSNNHQTLFLVGKNRSASVFGETETILMQPSS